MNHLSKEVLIKNRHKGEKLSCILNGMIFLFGSITYFQNGGYLFGAIQLITAIVSFVILFKHLVYKKYVIALSYLLNIIVAIFIAIQYLNSGTDYIHYVWMLVATFSLVALVVHLVKFKS